MADDDEWTEDPDELALESPRHLPAAFWGEREILVQIRQAAHSRQRSADAVLHAVLGRVAASIPHTIKLPPIVGSPAPLCHFTALVGPPGRGKGNAQDIAEEIAPVDHNRVVEVPLGSGEGLVEILLGPVKEPDPDDPSKLVVVKRQVMFNALVEIDEGDTLSILGGRSGSVLMSTLRSIWSGKRLGQSNASAERRRFVSAGQYTFGVTMGLQESKAGPLLNQVDAGTPQRFTWAMTTDPRIPDELPDWPVTLKWDPPGPQALRDYECAGTYVRHHMAVAQSVQAEIRAADLQNVRGNGSDDPFAAHTNLVRLKIAGLLALLCGGMNVTEDDWRLAGVVRDTSDNVRRHAQDVVRREAMKTEAATSDRLASRAVRSEDRKHSHQVVKAAERIVKVVTCEGGEMRKSAAQSAAGSGYRGVFNEAVDHAEAEGWLTCHEEHTESGRTQRLLRVTR
jgi:hypothetical protein